MAWGLICSPWGREGWAWPGCSCVGPREERIKGSHVGPAFISGLQRGANKLCPCARRQQLPPRSLLEAPACFSPPPSCSFPESQRRLISGHPKGPPPTSATQELKGGSARPREGRGWDPHTCVCSHRESAWEPEANTLVPSDLCRAFRCKACCPVRYHTRLLSTRYVARPQRDVSKGCSQIQYEQKACNISHSSFLH